MNTTQFCGERRHRLASAAHLDLVASRCRLVLFFSVVALTAISSSAVVAQALSSHVQAVRDNTYAARLAIEGLADEIRAGNTKGVQNAALAGALRGLFAAANERRVPQPPVAAPPMWDFRIDVTEANAVAERTVEMRVFVHLAVERDVGEPILIHLRREDGQWTIAEPAALVARVAAMHRQLALRKGAR